MAARTVAQLEMAAAALMPGRLIMAELTKKQYAVATPQGPEPGIFSIHEERVPTNGDLFSIHEGRVPTNGDLISFEFVSHQSERAESC